MNDIFEFKRFGLLLKKTILERPMQFMGVTALVLAATLIIYALALYALGWQPAQNLAFIWGLAGGGCFLSSLAFGYFSTNASGSAYLTLPASSFEKWLCGILIVSVFFTCIFLSFYRLMDILFVMAYHNGLDKHNAQYREMYDAVQVYTFDNNMVRQSTMLFVNLTGAMLVGSLYFNKVSAVKTALVYCGILGVIYFFNLALAYAFFENVDAAFPFHSTFIKVGNGVGSLELPNYFSTMVGVSVMYIVPGILWLTALVRLREKEI
jgi:hypothetical protein